MADQFRDLIAVQNNPTIPVRNDFNWKANHMPVYKYKTFEEAESALWNFRPDEAYFGRVAELWNFANKLCPITYPKGIFKYRSIEEANKQRNE